MEFLYVVVNVFVGWVSICMCSVELNWFCYIVDDNNNDKGFLYDNFCLILIIMYIMII